VVDSDAANVYITLTARALIPKLVIVARASDPASVDTLGRAGADRVVSPYLLSGRRMAFLAPHPAGESIAYPGPEVDLAAGDRVVVLRSLPASMPWGVSVCRRPCPTST
jgi:voltage-gated potassium channel Kch